TIVAKGYYYPAWISVTEVLYNETKKHLDEYYCFAFVKEQGSLGVPVVGRTFCTLQSAHEPVQVSDYYFVCGSN
ncbi:11414_t:CDS:2, partial [Gigaspora margarita]